MGAFRPLSRKSVTHAHSFDERRRHRRRGPARGAPCIGGGGGGPHRSPGPQPIGGGACDLLRRAPARRPALISTSATNLSSGKHNSNGPSPSKMPRLAQVPSNSGVPVRSATSMGTRTRPTSPVPSKLPTLVTNKRSNATNNPVPLPKTTSKKAPVNPDADPEQWMKTNASAVVVPGSKSARPGLRSIRRRRSSFSNADVVA